MGKRGSSGEVLIPATAKKHTSELPPQRKPVVGSTIVGIFQSFKFQTIHDQNTRQPKEVAVYTFIDPKTNERFAILGRSGLDTAFESCSVAEGGWPRMQGMMVAVQRGDDTKRARGGVIGNYDVYCWIPEREDGSDD